MSPLIEGEPVPGCPPQTRAFKMGSCSIIVGLENCGSIGDRWHLSIAHPARYPRWDEIKAARMRFIPQNVTMAFQLPGEASYVNLHNNCFHLWETRDL